MCEREIERERETRSVDDRALGRLFGDGVRPRLLLRVEGYSEKS